MLRKASKMNPAIDPTSASSPESSAWPQVSKTVWMNSWMNVFCIEVSVWFSEIHIFPKARLHTPSCPPIGES